MGRRTRLSFSALYASKFVHLGIQLPFFSGWLHLKGFSAGEIGLLTGAALAARLALGPLVALWSDSRRDARTGLRAVAGAFALAAGAVMLAPEKLTIAAAALGVLWAFGVLVPLADAGALGADRAGELNFGRTRALGSGAFLITTLLGGEALTRFGLDAGPAIMAAAALVTFAAALALPADQRSGVRGQARLAEARQLLQAPAFLVGLGASALIQGAHATYYSFSILHWSSLGYSPRVIGFLWATGVVAEIILLVRIKALGRRLAPPALMAIGASGATIRWLVTAAEPGLALLLVVQTLHALSFAATYVGALGFIEKAAPGRLLGAALTINSTAGVGAATGLATVLAGFIYERAGGPAAYAAMAGMAAAGLVLALALGRMWRGGRLFE